MQGAIWLRLHRSTVSLPVMLSQRHGHLNNTFNFTETFFQLEKEFN